MEELTKRLNEMPGTYYEFVDSAVDYAENKPQHMVLLKTFLDKNHDASPSDVIRFISVQPDFFDDDVSQDADVLVYRHRGE